MEFVPNQQLQDAIRQENTWWDTGKLPDFYSKLKPRQHIESLYDLLTNKDIHRAIILMGPRRVGKTVLLHHIIRRLLAKGIARKRICYISIDRPIYTRLGLEEFLKHYQSVTKLDIQKQSCYIFFDEIQYLRGWEQHLKSLVDIYPKLRIIVSGSAAAALRMKSIESGAGRFSDFTLPPLTFPEWLELQGKLKKYSTPRDINHVQRLNTEFLNYINFGGYPEIALSKELQKNPLQFLKHDIIDKVLLKDLPSLYGIRDVQELNAFFTTLAWHTGQEVSLDQLSKKSGVDKNSIRRYIEYLEAAFLVKRMYRVDECGKRFRRENFFKIYLTNPSLRTALFGPVKSNDPHIGSIVETTLYNHLYSKPLGNSLPSLGPHGPFYARWGTTNREVDFVILHKHLNPGVVIECKWSDQFVKNPARDLRSLIQFCHKNNIPKAIVTTKSIVKSQLTIENIDLNFYPTSDFCLFIPPFE